MVRAVAFGVLIALFGAPSPLTAAGRIVAQNDIAFGVASIRRNTGTSKASSSRALPGGRFTAANAELRTLIRAAYGLEFFQVVDGPARFLDARFDISAAELVGATSTPPSRADVLKALQRLLADRFRLVVHRESRPTEGYTLSVARSDGRFGPGLRRSMVDCVALRKAGELTPHFDDGIDMCAITGLNGRTRSGSASMASLARNLLDQLRAPVVDETGLSGNFEFDYTFAPADPSLRLSVTDVMLALREQLGLALVAKRIPVDAIVVDHVEEPTEN
jgi:uncharacterized protein (TIGR03435 family)